MMGEAMRQSRREETVRDVLQLLDAPPREVAGLQHLSLQLQVVHEWLCLVGNSERVDKALTELDKDYNLKKGFVAWIHAAIQYIASGGDARWQ